MALECNTLDNTVVTEANKVDVTKQTQARATDSNLISLVALLSNPVEDTAKDAKKKADQQKGADKKSALSTTDTSSDEETSEELGSSSPVRAPKKPNTISKLPVRSGSSSSSSSTSGASGTSSTKSASSSGILNYRQSLGALAELLSVMMSSMITGAEKMQKVNNDLDQAAIASAQDAVNQVDKEISDQAKAEQEQKTAHTWEIVGAVAGTIIGAIVAFFTGGAGAAIVAGCVGVLATTLTATGVLSDFTTWMATEFEKAGLSDGASKILSAVILIIAMTLLSAGTGAGVSGIVDGITDGFAGGAADLADSISDSVEEATSSAADDASSASDAADADNLEDITSEDASVSDETSSEDEQQTNKESKKITKKILKVLQQQISKLSSSDLQDGDTVGEVVQKVVNGALKDAPEELQGAADDITQSVTKDIMDVVDNGATKTQVLNGLKGLNAVQAGAIQGTFMGLGSGISGASGDMVDGVLDLVYGDSSKAPLAVRIILDVFMLIMSITASVLGGGAGNLAGYGTSDLANSSTSFAQFAEENSAMIAKVGAGVQTLVGLGTASAGVVDGVAVINQGEAQKQLAVGRAEQALAQYMMQLTQNMSSQDRDQLNQQMEEVSNEIKSVVNAMGSEANMYANISKHG